MMNANDTTVSSVDGTAAEITASSEYQGAEVTTMTTETKPEVPEVKAAPKAKKAKGKPYPFLTKAQIKASIEGDFAFACMVIGVLYDRQTAFEQDTKSTLNKNRRGFMSSHAVHGTNIALKLRNGESLTDEDKGRVEGIAIRYTKQMAEHFRDAAIEANPELAAEAACYFTSQ